MISWGVCWDGNAVLGVHTLDDEIRSQNTHGSDTNTGLRGTVGRAQAGEDDGSRAAHGAEEGL